MQDPSSYVYSGRDGSGAATILKPFDSSRIFSDYDKARAPKKNPILDSLGKDIFSIGGKARPQDRPAINKKLKDYIDEVSKLSADNVDLISNPGAAFSVTQKKQGVIDLESKSLRDGLMLENFAKDIKRNPNAYPPDAMQKLEAWDQMDIESRPATIPVSRLKAANFDQYFRQMGKELDVSGSHKNTDGSYTNYRKYDPSALPEVFKAVYDANENDPDFINFMAVAEADARDLANLQGVDFDNLPMQEKAQMTYAEAMSQFGAIKKSQIARRSGSGDAPDTEARKTAAKGKAQQDAIQQGYVVTARTVKNKDGDFDIKKVQSWVVANKETGNPADNTPMTFEGGVIGSPQRIENVEGKGTPTLVVRTGNGSTIPYEMVEIPLTPINASKLKAEYGFDWDKIKKDPVFIKKYEDFDVNKLTVKDFTDAAGSERNPASEAATQKALDKRKGTTTAPAKPAGSTKRYDPKTGKFVEYTPK